MTVSETVKNRPDLRVLSWLDSIKFEDAFLSVVTIGEIRRGLHRLQHLHGAVPIRHLQWIDEILSGYGRRILPVTTRIAERWGHLSFELKNDRPDLLIAATALEHDLTVATRNIRHFEPTGAKLFNPYEA